MKIVFLDVDGVVIASRRKYFSTRFSEDYGISIDAIMPLFKGEFKDCVMGKADLREVLKDYLPKWEWKGTMDELLKYWWEGENTPNEDVLNLTEDLKSKGVKFYLGSDQEKYRAKYLMDEVGLGKYFSDEFLSCNMGVSKGEKMYWGEVMKRLNVTNPHDIVFWDDEQENIDVANDYGIDARLYTNFDEFKKEMEKLIK